MHRADYRAGLRAHAGRHRVETEGRPNRKIRRLVLKHYGLLGKPARLGEIQPPEPWPKPEAKTK